jgi:hypothetical protein
MDAGYFQLFVMDFDQNGQSVSQMIFFPQGQEPSKDQCSSHRSTDRKYSCYRLPPSLSACTRRSDRSNDLYSMKRNDFTTISLVLTQR